MKKLIFISVLILSQAIFANEIKLNCKVSGKETRQNNSYNEDSKVEENLLIQIESSSDNKKLMISFNSQSIPITYFTNFINHQVVVFKDVSNKNKWEIYNEYKLKTGEGTGQILIDRNSGYINITNYITLSTSGILNVAVTGHCEKIDITKNKF